MKYYGAIVCEFDKGITMIEGNHDWKPPVESGGWSAICRWYESVGERAAFIDYAETIGYHLTDN